MKSHHVSIVMMTVILAYSAPIEYEYVSIEVTPSKPIERQNGDANSGSCCQTGSQSCCPYDYDDTCETASNRTLCGYNKNKKKSDEMASVTIYGLPCRVNDDRLECGYNGPYNTDQIPIFINNNPPNNPDCCSCCKCCNQETTNAVAISEATTTPTTTKTIEAPTVTTTKSTVETTTPTTTTTTPKPASTTTKYEITTKFKKLASKSPKFETTSTNQPTSCVSVEERCVITYDSPCIPVPPCLQDSGDDSSE